ncbi:MAG: hypothetical protein S4CHLAM20_00350 [Chlamydiia bacterium]|nr:hypothetical protein [Chlamydiia bacterium]
MKLPKSIKFMTILIVALSLLSGTVNKIFPSLVKLPNLIELFSIQLNTISSFKLWQFITHIFVYPAYTGIHIFYLINLFFSIMILQRMGSVIVHQKGEKKFIQFFLTCGIFSGLAAFATIAYFKTPYYYAGPSSTLYCLLVATIFLFPKIDFMLFISSPIKGKVLVPCLIGMMMLMSISAQDYVYFFATLGSIFVAYLYMLLFWKIESPYAFMNGFDRFIIHLSRGRIGSFYKTTKLDKYTGSTRIYDIKTGKAVLSEESFINACLEKISKEGKKSLTLYERFRLYRYSKKSRKTAN